MMQEGKSDEVLCYFTLLSREHSQQICTEKKSGDNRQGDKHDTVHFSGG